MLEIKRLVLLDQLNFKNTMIILFDKNFWKKYWGEGVGFKSFQVSIIKTYT